MGVRYKAVEGCSAYRVGTDGSVWSKLVRGPGRKMVMGDTWKKLKCNKTKGVKYVQVYVRTDAGVRRHVSVHRLVLLTFKGPPPEGKPQAAHKNGKSSDNRLVNLKWASAKENQADKIKHGTHVFGEKAFKAKLTPEKVQQIRKRVAAGEKMLRLSKEYKLSFAAVWSLVRRKSWKHVPDLED